MTRKGCGHAANALLPWYVNGSLEGAEESMVRHHLDDCSACAAGADVLSQVSRGLDRHGMTRSATASALRAALPQPRWRPSAAVATVAAVAAVAAVLAASWFFRDGAGGPPGGPDLSAAVVLDLGAGPVRAAVGPALLALEPETRIVIVRLTVPPRPEARYALQLQGPDGRDRGSRQTLRERDEMGYLSAALPADWFADPGVHILLVQDEGPEGDTRSYPFPVQVAHASGAGGPAE